MARHLGISQARISKTMALLDEPDDVQALITPASGDAIDGLSSLTEKHVAKARGAIREKEPRAELLRKAAREGPIDERRRRSDVVGWKFQASPGLSRIFLDPPGLSRFFQESEEAGAVNARPRSE